MRRFLVEAYAPRDTRVGLTQAVAQVRQVAREMTRGGVRVRHLRSILVPEDETCFHLFESLSLEAVEEVGRRAGLAFDRVTEAIEPVKTEGGVS